MRIVAGTAKGRPLQGPKGKGIRPTQDRVRETIFNVLGQAFDPIDVLDLYAGTGALALEALSRGAAKAVLVDSDREAVGLCRKNAEALGFGAQVEVWAMPAARALEKLAREGRRFELVFADPPYDALAVTTLLEGIGAGRLLTEQGAFVLEHDKREASPEALAGLARVDSRRFGDTQVDVYRQG